MFPSAHASPLTRLQQSKHCCNIHASTVQVCATRVPQSAVRQGGPGVLAVNSGVAAYASQAHSLQPRKLVRVTSTATDAADRGQSTQEVSERFTAAEHRQLWDSVSRALLKIGKAGASDSHARSLAELAASHKLVKVQLNGARDNPELVRRVAEDAVQRTAGAVELLQIKGVTMLFCCSNCSDEELLASAEASAAGTAVWKAKRAAAAADRREQREKAYAQQEANASRSRKRIGQMIQTVAKPSKGPLDKSALVDEWKQLAAGIIAEETAEGSSRQGPKGKAPWKK